MCTNGQENAEKALHFGSQLFRYARPEVGMLAVGRVLADPPRREEEWLERAKTILANYEIQANSKVRQGSISEEIIRESQEGNYDLVVIGSRGYSEILAGVTSVSLGEVAQGVIEKTETSLLVVKDPRPLHKVLMCTDGSSNAEEAIHFYGKLSLQAQPRINVFNVVPEIYSRFRDILEPVAEHQLDMLGALPGKRTEYLYRGKDILSQYEIQAKIKLREGQAAEEILKEADNDYDLIMMGVGGRKGDKKETIGRQTRRVIRQTKIPVLAIRPNC